MASGAAATRRGDAVSWSALFGAFVLSHLLGDYVLQTDWQANQKQHGLIGGGAINRRALMLHGLTYTAAFVPVLVWVGIESGVGVAIAVAALILLPHVIVDDGVLVSWWIRHVKNVPGPPTTVVRLGVDQSAHLVALAAVALLVTG
jgi:hypothetical protein